MKTPKIITFIAFIWNSILTYRYSEVVFKIHRSYQELGMQKQFPFPWFLLIPLIFAVGSLGYWFYLKSKEKKGKKVKFALLISIILLLAPSTIMPSIVAPYLITPVYKLLESL
jgi:cytochrome bd-type quinol oxidase subunit 2